MAIAEVTAQRSTTSGYNSISLAYPNDVTSGSVLVVGFSGGRMSGTGTVTATGAGAPTAWAVLPTMGSDTIVLTGIAWGVAPATGACTVTLDGALYCSYTITEFTGVSATPPMPVFMRALNQSVGDTAPTVTIAGILAGAVVLGCVNTGNGSTITPGSGWTQIGEYETYASFYTHSLICQIVPSDGAYSPNWTLGSATLWGCCAAVLSPGGSSSGGGGGSYTFLG